LEKVACGAFSDSGFVADRKRRGFCGLRSVGFVVAAKRVTYAAC